MKERDVIEELAELNVGEGNVYRSGIRYIKIKEKKKNKKNAVNEDNYATVPELQKIIKSYYLSAKKEMYTGV